MKFITLTIGIFFTLSSFALENFPNGHFKGEGYWRTVKGETGKYTVELTIKDNTFNSKMQFEGEPNPVENSSTIEMGENQFFKVKSDDKVVGRGYCGSVWCHLEGRDKEMGRYENTITFFENEIYALGSGRYEGQRFMWEETLKRVE